MKEFLLLFMLFCCLNAYSQDQIGSVILGLEDDDATGRVNALSSDGLSLIVGSRFYGSNEGAVRVFENINSNWEQKGQTIFGDPFEQLGQTLAISGNGDVIAVGKFNEVILFEFINNSWIAKGQAITEDEFGEGIGSSVALSFDGTIVACGANFSDSNGRNSGLIRVFSLDNGVWTQMGTDITGPSPNSRLGDEIAISDDGLTVVGGMPENDDVASNSGKVQIFRFSSNVWSQVGQDLTGVGAREFFGSSIDISGNGNVIAIASSGEYASTIYEFLAGFWVQRGNVLGGNTDDRLSSSISLSFNGSLVAIGDRSDSTNGRSSGRGLLFSYNVGSDSWTQVGSQINGDLMDDNCGYSISLSADGMILSLGTVRSQINNTNPGFISVYDFGVALPVIFSSFNAWLDKEIVYVNWATSFEMNCQLFEVERSADGILWEVVEGFRCSTTNQVSEYDYKDINPLSGVNYYRIVQYDIDQSIKFSQIKRVHFSSSTELKIYPNPAISQLSIISSNNDIESICFLNSDSSFKSFFFSSFDDMDVSLFERGLYFVLIQTKDQKVIVRQLVLN